MSAFAEALSDRLADRRTRLHIQAALYVAGGVGVVVALVLSSGAYLDTALIGWFDGAFGSSYAATQTIQNATTLTLVALGAAVALRTGVISIGGEGQVIVGAIAATAVALGLGEAVPHPVALVLGVVAGAVGGVLWALPPAFAKWRWNVNEILFTLLMNYVAVSLLAYLLRTSLRDPQSNSSPQSAPIPGASMLPLLPVPGHLHAGVLLVVLAVVVGLWFHRTGWAFLLDVHRTRPALASRAGLGHGRAILVAFVVSGAAAGAAGWVQLAGVTGRLEPNITAGLGFSAVAVAVLGRFHPIGIAIAAIFYASLGTGSAGVQLATGTTPAAIGTVSQGILLLTAALVGAVMYAARRTPGGAGTPAATAIEEPVG
ncbi:ABC transporter permease [Gordonia sp. NPDC003376]